MLLGQPHCPNTARLTALHIGAERFIVCFFAKFTMCARTMCEYLLYFRPFSHVQQQQTEGPLVSKGFFVCGIKMTDLSGFVYERLHADSLKEMHV